MFRSYYSYIPVIPRVCSHLILGMLYHVIFCTFDCWSVILLVPYYLMIMLILSYEATVALFITLLPLLQAFVLESHKAEVSQVGAVSYLHFLFPSCLCWHNHVLRVLHQEEQTGWLGESRGLWVMLFLWMLCLFS